MPARIIQARREQPLHAQLAHIADVIAGPGCLGFCITPLAIVAENVLTDHRRKIAVRALTIDFQNKLLGSHALSSRNFLEGIPKTIFQAHARLVASIFLIDLPIFVFVRGRAERRLPSVISSPRGWFCLGAIAKAQPRGLARRSRSRALPTRATRR